MNPTSILETQCSHSEFMQFLPLACGQRSYEIVDNQVTVHDKNRQIRITVHDEPIRHLGSVSLPMEKVEFSFQGHTEEEADAFREPIDSTRFELEVDEAFLQ